MIPLTSILSPKGEDPPFFASPLGERARVRGQTISVSQQYVTNIADRASQVKGIFTFLQ